MARSSDADRPSACLDQCTATSGRDPASRRNPGPARHRYLARRPLFRAVPINDPPSSGSPVVYA
jgi:hypothetical protein